jgi:hypothetical protein
MFLDPFQQLQTTRIAQWHSKHSLGKTRWEEGENLQVSTKSFTLKGGPDGKLDHCIGLSGPIVKLVGIDSELLFVFRDSLAVLKKQNLFARVSVGGLISGVYHETRGLEKDGIKLPMREGW